MLAFYIAFFHGHTLTEDGLIGDREGNSYTIKDERTVLEFYYAHRDENVKDLVHAVCTNTAFWGEDLTEITGFETAVCNYLKQICEKETYAVMEALVK